MNRLSVVIPSKNIFNLIPCVEAVRRHAPDVRVIVVDDGIDWRQEPPYELLPEPHFAIPGVSPFVFARNVNIGIMAAGSDDVILLNDDAMLEVAGGFSALQVSAERDHRIGLISSTTNLAGNPAQAPRRAPMVWAAGGLRECPVIAGHSAPVVAFVCVLIPRRTLDLVGLLDERFVAYGWEDNDYCRRVFGAGLRVCISDDCYVEHAKLQSTFRGQAYAAGDIRDGQKIYLEKWGKL